MNALFVNWKTGLAGVVIIALGALSTFVGIKIPGFSMDFSAALLTGIGLVFAKDNNVTGGA